MTGLRRWLLALAAVVTMTAAIGARSAQAQTSFYGSATSGSFGISFFYDELDDYGQWVDYGDYGACWVPADVGYGWRPYMRGYWTYTDYGWTWASYEPWGWATYHYGRWVFDPYYGWVWVPGTVWAPAWVAWREADDCIGWAPLPPQVGWSVSVGLTFGNSYSHSYLPYDRWVFVDRYRFDSRDVSSIAYPVTRNEIVYRQSRDATRFRVRDGAPINDGIRVANLERSLGRRIPRMRVAAVDSPDRGQGRQIDGRTVGFFRPQIRGSRRDLTQRVERIERERGRSFQRVERGRGFDRARTDRIERQQSNRNRIERGIERARDNGRSRQVERGTIERRSRMRTERPTFDDFRQRSERQREAREFQRSERGREARELQSRRAREAREFRSQREREAREFQSQRGRDEERGFRSQRGREAREFQRPERGEAREFEREDRGRESRGFQRQERTREVRESRGSERMRGRDSDDREEESGDERGGGKGRGNGRGKR